MSAQEVAQTQAVAKPTITTVAGGLLQRACACGKHSGNGGECEECKRKRQGILQRSATTASPVNEVPAIVHEVLRTSGQPLDSATRAFMEPRFKQRFSEVRVHTDSLAGKSARAVNALAYTVGNDMVFAAGQYAPESNEGRRLLAHELAHTVQQHEMNASPTIIDKANSPLERQAEHAADCVTSGTPLSGLAQGNLPVVARQAETKPMPNQDGSVDRVTRNVIPGKCTRVPDTQSKTAGDITSQNAFFQIDLCRGKVSGQIRGQLNYGEALEKAGQAVGKLLARSTSPQGFSQGLSSFTNDLKQLKSDAEIKLNLLASDVFRVDISGLGDASPAGGVSGQATARAEFSSGPVKLFLTGTASGGSEDQTRFEITGGIRIGGGRQRAPDCHVCRCREPKITFSCEHVPGKRVTPPPQSPPAQQTRYLPYFFKKAEITANPRLESVNETNLSEAVRLLDNNYTVARIEGAASPEGPAEGRENNPGSFRNNTILSEQRAKEGRNRLNAAIRRAAMQPRGSVSIDELLRWLRADYPVVGRGELLGSSERGEIPDDKLAAHLKQTVKESGQGNLERLYETLRRVVIVLNPPLSRPNLTLDPARLENIVGQPIDCTEAHKKLFEAAPIAHPFEGECDAPGKQATTP